MTFSTAGSEPRLIYDEAAAGRVIDPEGSDRQRRRQIRQYVRDGLLDGRQLPDGRLVITREAIITFIANLPAWGGGKR